MPDRSDESREPIESAATGGSTPAGAPIIPDYELVHRLGRGAFGEVWLARSLTGIFLAVKVLPKNERTDFEIEGIRNYQHHARRHPNLIDILHIGQTSTHYYYVLDLADSLVSIPVFAYEAYVPRTLRAELDRRSRFGIDAALHVMRALLAGLEHLHAQGLLHRDIKPDNVIYVNAEPKLADVGLVTRTADPGRPALTPQYAPPEGVVDRGGDLYCTGKLLAEMLLGYLPSEPPPWTVPRDVASPGRVRAALEIAGRAASPIQRRRYTSAADMARDLDAIVDVRGVLAALAPRSKRVAGIGIAAIVAIGLGLLGQRFAIARSARRSAVVTPATDAAPFTTANALRFESATKRVARAPSSDRFDFNDGFTLEFWMEPLGIRNRALIIGRGNDTTRSWALWRRDRRLALEIAGKEISSPNIMDFYQLGHFAVSWEAGTGIVSFYRDGALRATSRGPTALQVGSTQLTFGGTTEDGFDAIVSEVRAWNRVRTAEEIAGAALQVLPPAAIADARLAAYWPMNEGTGQFARDASGHGNHLTLGSTPAAADDDPQWTGPLPASVEINPDLPK